mmetsp:Transcript_88392/g.175749  ORF Transcript_88392/g.175749 Transcript_88392/m.175749 type:complete len:202 (+) Transcript_88392:75-680(+)|eukprot:CAMPEP_0172871732 /NCGR_PEP_ID=MMETSP1075-20121228/92251_1 /TAXON_ID=2916 /ORGANISM="Ceratium fusus, Strain PA161109" /LENGTH=201 /DNA_ID=CAMNT_0013722007 /DNA_START=58 /DNA_END=663 /DNA_ORIENTATION=+
MAQPTVVGAPSGETTSTASSTGAAASAEIAVGAAKEHLDALHRGLGPLLQAYTLRPWGHFMKLRRPADAAEARRRVSDNFGHFQANYAVVTLVVLLVAFLTQPTVIVALLIVVALWVLLAKQGALDPDKQLNLGGNDLTVPQRALMMCAGSVCLLYLATGNLLLWLVAFLAVVAVAHAALHPGAAAVGDYSSISAVDLDEI